LFVASPNDNFVQAFAPPYTSGPYLTLQPQTNEAAYPVGIAFDPNGNLYLTSQYNGDTFAYAPPYTGAAFATLTNGMNGAYSMRFDGNGNLWVIQLNANTPYGGITAYAPPYTGAPAVTVTNNMNGPSDLAFDTSGNMFVTDYDGTTAHVQEYAPPYTGASIATFSAANSVTSPSGVPVHTTYAQTISP
jgi:hypothetical protein